MTTTEQLERTLLAIETKGDKFAPLMPDRFRFEVNTEDVDMACLDTLGLLRDELVRRGYVVHSWSNIVSYCFEAIKQPHD